MNETEQVTFEQALERLEQIVTQLDAGDLPLEESIKLFEEGMALKTLCLERLKEAEAVVQQYAPAQETDQEDSQTEQEEG